MIACLIFALAIFGATACSSASEEDSSTEETGTTETEVAEEVEETNEYDEERDGLVKSYLTGEWISEDIARSRPIAIMTGNTESACPQYGLNSAAIIYEAPVEGSLTRLMQIIEDYSGLERIGSIRSCRPYYLDFANEFDALYVHVGQAYVAEDLLNSGYIDNISGLDGAVSSTFYRSTDKSAPHNCYTSEEGILEGIANKGYSTTYDETYEGHYHFADEDALNDLEDGEDVSYIEAYYYVNHPYFIYDEETQLYTRYQYGDVQVDGNDGEAVTVTNIIFQNVEYGMYDDYYLNITTSGSGAGKFFTHGKMIDITWTKESDGVTHYYDANGEEIALNPGRTWVCIIQQVHEEDNVYSATVE